MTMSILTVRRWIFLAPLALVLLAAVALASAATSGAQTNPCQDQLDVLREDTQKVPITSPKVDKERAGLLKIIDDAESLTLDGKTSDAVTKLRNFTVKVDQLEAAGRIGADDAFRLRSEAQAAIACLDGSTTSTA
jgi:hypothetical protein